MDVNKTKDVQYICKNEMTDDLKRGQPSWIVCRTIHQETKKKIV